jgi:hypothetical protein
MSGHIGADLRGILAPTRRQRPIMVPLTRFRPAGFGMAQKHQAKHGDSIDFAALKV